MDNLNLNYTNNKIGKTQNCFHSNPYCYNSNINEKISLPRYSGYHFDLKIKNKVLSSKKLQNTTSYNNYYSTTQFPNKIINQKRVGLLKRNQSDVNISSSHSSYINSYSYRPSLVYTNGKSSKLNFENIQDNISKSPIQSERLNYGSQNRLSNDYFQENKENTKLYNSRNFQNYTRIYNYNQYIKSNKQNSIAGIENNNVQYISSNIEKYNPYKINISDYSKTNKNYSMIDNTEDYLSERTCNSKRSYKKEYSGSYIKGRKDSTRSTQVNSFDESVIGNKKIESIEDMHLNFVKYLQSTKKELIDQEKLLEE